MDESRIEALKSALKKHSCCVVFFPMERKYQVFTVIYHKDGMVSIGVAEATMEAAVNKALAILDKEKKDAGQ